jgi:hypothetical protein
LGQNTQAVDQPSARVNRQATDDHSTSLNRQGANEPATPTNNQAAPSDPPVGNNFQNLQNKAVQDHLEKVPTQTIERATVDFSHKDPAASQTAAHAGAAATKPKVAPLHVSLVSKHEKAMDEFHGRLKGIKQNVDQLNHRLSNFEAEIAKKPAES